MNFAQFGFALSGAVLGMMFTFIGKVLWDHQRVGRVERRAIYALETDCEKRRAECCVPALKREMGTIDTRLKETEKKLDHGEAKFDTILNEISGLKNVMERIQAVIEYALEIKQKKEG